MITGLLKTSKNFQNTRQTKCIDKVHCLVTLIVHTQITSVLVNKIWTGISCDEVSMTYTHKK